MARRSRSTRSTTSTAGRRSSLRRSGSSRVTRPQCSTSRQAEHASKSSSSRKKKEKRPSVDEIIKQAGRWFSRAVDPFINVKNAIVVGMKGSDEDDADEDEEAQDKDEDHEEAAVSNEGDEGNEEEGSNNPAVDIDLRSKLCFDVFSSSKDQDFIGGCRILVEFETDLPRLNKLLKAMQAASNSARSDDTGKLLPNTLKLLKRNRNHSFKKPEPVNKCEFGFNHEDIARFLIAIDDKQKFDADPAVYMEAVQNGEISNEWWCLPLFLFDEDLVETDHPTAGLFRGYVLVRFFCHIFLGSGLPERQGKTNGRDTVATRHAMTTVTGHHIAYAATQARYCMGTVEKWQQFDGGFDLWRFFWSIVDFFEGADKNDAAEGILAWWNKEVFSTRNAVKPKEEKSSGPPPTSRYAIMQEERRQAKKAREEAKELEARQVQEPGQQEPEQRPTAHTQPDNTHSACPSMVPPQPPRSRSRQRTIHSQQQSRSRSPRRVVPSQQQSGQRSRSRSRDSRQFSRDNTPEGSFRSVLPHPSSKNHARKSNTHPRRTSSSRERSAPSLHQPSESPPSRASLQRLRRRHESPSHSDEHGPPVVRRRRSSPSPERGPSSREQQHASQVMATAAPRQSKNRHRFDSGDEEQEEPSKKRAKKGRK